MSEIKKPFRYPGTRPFTEEDQLFFGRDEDIEQMRRQIKVEKLVVLFSKSGLGKSSLLNAGVIPKLKNQDKFLAITVRFGLEDSENLTRRVIFLNKLAQFVDYDNLLWNKLVPDVKNSWTNGDGDESFWLGCKSLQIRNPEQPVIIILDQFEELFTAEQKEVDRFAFLLSTLLYGQVPQAIKDLVVEKLKTDKTFFTREETNLLFEPLNIKILISIRSDKLSFLNRFKTCIPQILKKTYELQPLDIKQATDALLKPPSTDGDFASPKFEYEDLALDKIIGYLRNNEDQIEAFQLQMICQFCENLILKPESFSKVNNLGKVMAKDLGDLSTIFERHYDNLINEITDNNQQLDARRLIEENMIIDGKRESVSDKAIILKYHITDKVLKKLLESRLLRSEPNTTGGFSYEISHDALISPITKSLNIRLEAEKKERIEALRLEELRIANEKAEKVRLEREREAKQHAELLALQQEKAAAAENAARQAEENCRNQRIAAIKQRKLTRLVTVVAVMALFAAGFGFLMMKKANNNLARFLKTDADKQYNEEQFIPARGEYNNLLKYTDKPDSIRNMISLCTFNDSIKKLFDPEFSLAYSLINSHKLEQLLSADSLIRLMTELKYEPAREKLEALKAQHDEKVKTAVIENKDRVRKFMEVPDKQLYPDAKKLLLKLQQVAIGDQEIIDLLKLVQ